ncbi:MAG: DsbA family protein [Candidatus Harrisonbacteria bacterium]|nr:DsbA family protein [Candidatus Harrisonbacteria bacterium]
MDTENQKPQSSGNNQNIFLPASILIAAVLISGSLIYSTGKKAAPSQLGANTGEVVAGVTTGKELELTSEDVVLGDLNAPVTVVEYGDFQCPFCGRFYSTTENQIRENYVKSNKVKFVYRHFAFLGPESRVAANAAECAKDQGKFWAYHDSLYDTEIKDGEEHNGNLNRDLFLSLAKDLSLNENDFTACLDSNKYDEKVQKDYVGAQALGVRATPTIFVDDKKVEGALPYEQFKLLIDQELSK